MPAKCGVRSGNKPLGARPLTQRQYSSSVGTEALSPRNWKASGQPCASARFSNRVLGDDAFG